jgi:proline iminopeptidase
MRGIFLGRKSELDWNYLPNAGHAMFYPEAYESLVNHLPEEERVDLPVAYYKRLMSSDPEARTAAARSWNSYEIHASKVDPVPEDLMKLDDDNYNLAHATLECHYFINGIFLEEGQLLKKKNIDKMRHIPGRSRRTVVYNQNATLTQEIR